MHALMKLKDFPCLQVTTLLTAKQLKFSKTHLTTLPSSELVVHILRVQLTGHSIYAYILMELFLIVA